MCTGSAGCCKGTVAPRAGPVIPTRLTRTRLKFRQWTARIAGQLRESVIGQCDAEDLRCLTSAPGALPWTSVLRTSGLAVWPRGPYKTAVCHPKASFPLSAAEGVLPSSPKAAALLLHPSNGNEGVLVSHLPHSPLQPLKLMAIYLDRAQFGHFLIGSSWFAQHLTICALIRLQCRQEKALLRSFRERVEPREGACSTYAPDIGSQQASKHIEAGSD